MKERRERKEERHYMRCPDCGESFDMRDLAQVFSHQHWLKGKPQEISCSYVQQVGNDQEFYVKTAEKIITLRYRRGATGYPPHRA